MKALTTFRTFLLALILVLLPYIAFSQHGVIHMMLHDGTEISGYVIHAGSDVLVVQDDLDHFADGLECPADSAAALENVCYVNVNDIHSAELERTSYAWLIGFPGCALIAPAMAHMVSQYEVQPRATVGWSFLGAILGIPIAAIIHWCTGNDYDIDARDRDDIGILREYALVQDTLPQDMQAVERAYAFAQIPHSIQQEHIDSVGNFPNESGVYLSSTYTFQFGGRLSLGYEIARILAAFVSYSPGDTWSRNGAGKLGLGLSISVPIEGTTLSPTLEFGTGSDGDSGNILVDCDRESTFSYFALGMRNYLSDHFYLYGAVAFSSTNAHQSGGCESWFGPREPRVDVKQSHVGVSIGIGLTAI